MQIPEIPFSFVPDFLRPPQPGVRQQLGDEVQVKAGAVETAPPAGHGAKSARGAGTAGLSTATTLAEAVQALHADGRLPRRGSPLDLSV